MNEKLKSLLIACDAVTGWYGNGDLAMGPGALSAIVNANMAVIRNTASALRDELCVPLPPYLGDGTVDCRHCGAALLTSTDGRGRYSREYFSRLLSRLSNADWNAVSVLVQSLVERTRQTG